MHGFASELMKKTTRGNLDWFVTLPPLPIPPKRHVINSEHPLCRWLLDDQSIRQSVLPGYAEARRGAGNSGFLSFSVNGDPHRTSKRVWIVSRLLICLYPATDTMIFSQMILSCLQKITWKPNIQLSAALRSQLFSVHAIENCLGCNHAFFCCIHTSIQKLSILIISVSGCLGNVCFGIKGSYVLYFLNDLPRFFHSNV